MGSHSRLWSKAVWSVLSGKVILKAGPVLDYGFLPLSLTFCTSKMVIMTMNENRD